MGLTQMHIKELLDEGRVHACEGVGPDHVCVKIAAIAELPSRFGQFHIVQRVAAPLRRQALPVLL